MNGMSLLLALCLAFCRICMSSLLYCMQKLIDIFIGWSKICYLKNQSSNPTQFIKEDDDNFFITYKNLNQMLIPCILL